MMNGIVTLFILLQSWTIVTGNLYWKVLKKATDYGQTITLICEIEDDFQSNIGYWDRYEDRPYSRLLFSVKKNKNISSHYKYGGEFVKGGFTLEIKNLSRGDLNSSYECTTLSNRSKSKELSEKDVFTGNLNLVLLQKIKSYGDTLKLLCETKSCNLNSCPWKYAWSKQNNESMFKYIDVNNGEIIGKYFVKLVINGFTLEIRNFSSKDMDFNYKCHLPFNNSISLELTRRNIFKDYTTIMKEGQTGGAILWTVIGSLVVFLVILINVIIGCCHQRRRKFEPVRTDEDVDWLASIREELSYLSSQDAQTFVSNLRSGFYLSYVGKIMSVGNEAVGKTAITTVLKGGIPEQVRKSTEGIDLHIHKAAVNIKSRKWVLRELDIMDVTYRDLLNEQREEKKKEDVLNDSKEENNCISKEPEKTGTSSEHSQHLKNVKLNSKSTTEMKENKKQELRMQKLKVPFAKCKHFDINEIKKEGLRRERKGLLDRALAPINMMDFGGQTPFYSTHQSFLTYRGIYILVIDGSKDFDEVLETEPLIPGRYGKPTTREFTLFWVNSIESYSRGGSERFPKILIVCTHKDKVPKSKVDEKISTILTDIEKMFEGTTALNHLVLERRLFLNALDPNDPGYEQLKVVLVDLLCKQPSWGKKLPKSWICLKMMIHKSVKNGDAIMELDTLRYINQNNPIEVLLEKDLQLFLKIHHAQGDIIYFPVPGLKDSIVISPQFLIKALQSLITDKSFCKDQRQRTVQSMNENGVLRRKDIENIWNEEQDLFKHKDFLISLMNHLDILATPRQYDDSGRLKKSDIFYVPCLVKSVNPKIFAKILNGRAIGLSFKFPGEILPPAIGYRFIASCINMYEIKRYFDAVMLYSGMVVVRVKKNIDLFAILRSNRIDIFLVHENSCFNIVRDTAAGIFECLKNIVASILESYTVTSSEDGIKESFQFKTEFPCYNATFPCYNQGLDNWTCEDHGHTITKKIKAMWTTYKNSEPCTEECEGLSGSDLTERLTELHLAKLALQFSWNDTEKLVLKIGLKQEEIENIKHDYGAYINNVIFMCLIKWNAKKDGTVGDIVKAIRDLKLDVHAACKIIRDEPMSVPDELWMEEPTDKILDAISAEVIMESLLLSVQLGHKLAFWLRKKYEGDKIIEINREVLTTWRSEHPGKTGKDKMIDLAQALCNVGKNISQILQDA